MTGRRGSTGFEPEPNPPADAPESVPGYRDLARIGHGGFSVVYRAVQESFERAVALKVLTMGTDEEARRRFLREVRLASRLSGHPHVVTVLDTGMTASGRPYLAMDLYDGGSMKERLKRSGPLSPAQAAMVGAKIAEALAAAHALGVLHRDVTPNNILVSRFGEPALADFGVSCLLDSSSSASVLDVFSPQHAAPELMTRGVPTVASDVYGLGSTLHQLLTGQPPFGGEGRDVRSIMWRAVSEPAPRPDCPGLPELADAILRAMAKEPDERFPDAAEFARTLRALIPEGAPSALPMHDRVESSSIGPTAVAAAAAVTPESTYSRQPAPSAPALDPDTTSAGRLRSADHTMVRPDRADPARRSSHAANSRRERSEESKDGRRRVRTPLLIAAVVALLGGGTWALFASQDSSSASHNPAAAHHSFVTAAAFATPTRSARPTAKAMPTPRRTDAHVTGTGAVTSPGAPPSASATSTSGGLGSLLPLPGTYHRLQNEQTGTCLAAGGSAPAQQSCATDKSEGWQYSLPLTGILSSGGDELVNELSGLCLTAGSAGAVSAQSCNGASAQLWSVVSGPGSSKEFQNAGVGQCLQAAQAVVSYGSCSSSDHADLWTEDGTE
jgi:predicted ribosomally synthesized peptide with SipW-like signal peptide